MNRTYSRFWKNLGRLEFLLAAASYLISLETGRGADAFQKGTDLAPVGPTQPFIGPNDTQGGMPYAARQISIGPDGKSVVLGAPEQPLDLPALLDEALRHNPATQQAWEQTLASVANLKVSKSAYYPTVTLMGNGTGTHQTIPNYQGGGNQDTLQAGPELQVQYLLLDFGARAAGVEAARFQLLTSDYNQNATLQNLVLQVAQNYYTLDGAKANVANAEAALQLAQYSAKGAELRFQAGLGTSTALAEARQSVAQAQYNLENARGQVQTAEVSLATSLGLPANAAIYVAPPSRVPTAAALSDGVDLMIDRALRQRPDLAAKYATFHQLKAQAAQADANRGPQLTVGAQAERNWYRTTETDSAYSFGGFSSNGTFTGHTDEAEGLLTFSLDLFDGGYRLNLAREARRNADAAKAALASAELTVISDVVLKFVAFKTSLQEYSAGEALVTSSLQSFDSTSAGYKAGLTGIIDFLTAQNNLASARYTLSNSRTALFTASAQLANATGSLLPPSEIKAASADPAEVATPVSTP